MGEIRRHLICPARLEGKCAENWLVGCFYIKYKKGQATPFKRSEHQGEKDLCCRSEGAKPSDLDVKKSKSHLKAWQGNLRLLDLDGKERRAPSPLIKNRLVERVTRKKHIGLAAGNE